ncbi:MAG: hypothetical protein GF315_14295 [candidate division Zixibacteria bacterium]|nr:hypothetical protein [candidate division Zixibacteria bacterium]
MYIYRTMRAAIINSRQSKRPLGTDAWIKSTLKAVECCADNGYDVVSSIGMNTYELLTYAIAKRGIPMILVIAGSAEPAEDVFSIISNFNIDDAKAEFLFLDDVDKPQKSRLKMRDEIVVSMADVLIPVSIRPGGNLSKLIEKYQNDKITLNDFMVPYDESRGGYKEDYSTQQLSKWTTGNNWNYLTHWTRTSNGKWHREKEALYYQAVINSFDEYARSGKATLRRIINEGRLIASNRHLHRNVEAVAFTGLSPAESVKLMKWRPRLVAMNFEPYGIAIDKQIARQLGIRKVLYGSPEMYNVLSNADRPFFHSLGEIGEWMPEQEFRHLGDFSFNEIPRDKLKIIVKTDAEVAEFERITSFEVLPLFEV